MAWVCVMQYVENLSDRQAAEAVRARIDWKYALSLELTENGFDDSVRSEFRKRLIDGQLETDRQTTMLNSFRGVEIDRLANFDKPVETVLLSDYVSKDAGGRTDLKQTDSGDAVEVITGICEVFNELSYGDLESVYYRALEVELGVQPFCFDQELAFDVFKRASQSERKRLNRFSTRTSGSC